MSGFYNHAFYDAAVDHGYWSPSTSTSHFCEHDYETSYYIAEFINTLSNAAYLYFALKPRTTSPYSTSIAQPTTKSLSPVIWDVHTFGLLAVGITSAIFHATLRHVPQLLDESLMYVLAAGFCWDLLITSYESNRSVQMVRKHGRAKYAMAIAAITITTTAVSLITGYLIVHSITFAIMIVVSGAKLIRLLRSPLHPDSTRKQYWWSFVKSNILLDSGFALWLIDCNPEYCAILRGFRTTIEAKLGIAGVYLGYFTQLHGWWHVLTAAAAAEYITLIRDLTRGSSIHRKKTE